MTLIPEPRRILKRTIQCPDCAHTWPLRAAARYELHWRLVHGADPVASGSAPSTEDEKQEAPRG